jgi:hypothetical protein
LRNTPGCFFNKKPLYIQRLFLFVELFKLFVLKRLSDEIVPLCSHNAGFGELSDSQGFAYFFRWQQFHHAINLRRVGIGSTNSTLFA